MKNDVILRYNEILEGILINYIFEDDINDILYQAMRRYGEVEKLKDMSEKSKASAKIKKLNKFDLEKEIFAYTDNKELINTLVDFCEMRESIGKKIKTRGTLTRLFNRLNNLSNNNDSVKIKLLDKAILNNWQSVWSENDKGFAKKQGYTYLNTPTYRGDELERTLLSNNDLDKF